MTVLGDTPFSAFVSGLAGLAGDPAAAAAYAGSYLAAQAAGCPVIEAAQSSVAPVKTDTTAQAQAQLQQLLAENQRLRAENQQFQQVQANVQVNACLNNLRQIDSAKQQWALENKKPVSAPVSAQDIQPYLPNNALPVCPLGGLYALHTVGLLPTCSIPGHVLPQQ